MAHWNRETEEISRIRAALGNTCAAVFDRMPPHTPRKAVMEAAEMARIAGADLLVTVGGGSSHRCGQGGAGCASRTTFVSPEALDALRPTKAPDGTMGPPPCNAPTVRQIAVPTTLSAGEFSAGSRGVTDELVDEGERIVSSSVRYSERSHSRPCDSRFTPRSGFCSCLPVFVQSTIALRASARGRRIHMPMPWRFGVLALFGWGLRPG